MSTHFSSAFFSSFLSKRLEIENGFARLFAMMVCVALDSLALHSSSLERIMDVENKTLFDYDSIFGEVVAPCLKIR
jgi:hypothetical protein